MRKGIFLVPKSGVGEYRGKVNCKMPYSMLEQEEGRLDFSSLNHYIPVAVKCVLRVSGILSEFLVNLSKSHGTISDEFSI